MASSKTYDATVSIHGAVNQDLQRSLGLTSQELSKMQTYVKGLNQLAAKSNLAFNGLPGSLQSSVDKIDAMTQNTSKLQSVIGNITQIASGVGIGTLLAQGFDFVISQAEKLRDLVGESIQKAADFQRTQEQLGIEMGVGMDSPQAKELLSKLQYYSDTSPFKMSGVSESMRMLLSTGFTPDKAMTLLKEIGDVAAATTPSGMSATEHLKQLDEAVNKAVKGGALLERTLYMFEDAGVQIRPFLEKKLGLAPGSIGDLHDEAAQTDLAKQIKKRNVSSNLILDFLQEVTSKGGKYEGGAFKMSHDFLGAESTLTDKIETFMRGIGDAFMGPMTQLMKRINDSFTWDKFKSVQQFFDDVATKANAAFTPFLDKLSSADWNRINGDFVKLAESGGKALAQLEPLAMWFADVLPPSIDMLVRFTTAITNLGTAIEKTFGWMFGIRDSKAIHQTASDAVNAAQEKLNALVSAGASDEDIAKAKQHLIDAEKAQKDSSEQQKATTDSVSNANRAVQASLEMLQQQADRTSVAMGGIVNRAQSLGGNAGLHGGLGSTSDWTIYGPGVAGDQPGHRTYDWDSYHSIGHIEGKEYHLEAGDTAMNYDYATRHYGIKPGDSYISDKDHKRHTWKDTTGSKNPENEDVFVPKLTFNYTINGAGDSDHFRKMLREHSDEVAQHVQRAFDDQYSRTAAI